MLEQRPAFSTPRKPEICTPPRKPHLLGLTERLLTRLTLTSNLVTKQRARRYRQDAEEALELLRRVVGEGDDKD